jgi:hypothetical protein
MAVSRFPVPLQAGHAFLKNGSFDLIFPFPLHFTQILIIFIRITV